MQIESKNVYLTTRNQIHHSVARSTVIYLPQLLDGQYETLKTPAHAQATYKFHLKHNKLLKNHTFSIIIRVAKTIKTNKNHPKQSHNNLIKKINTEIEISTKKLRKLIKKNWIN